jgi:uncharacterized membrane protein YdbT with pleckstrin-like domain
MSYLDNLAAGEQIVHRTRKTGMILLDTVIFTIISIVFFGVVYTQGWFGSMGRVQRAFLAASPFFVALLLLINDIILFISVEIVITNTRILGKRGLVSLSVLNVPLNRVTDVKVEMSVLGKMFDYGNITILSPGGDHVYKKINNPRRVQNLIHGLTSANN